MFNSLTSLVQTSPIRFSLFSLIALSFGSCASGYDMIRPQKLSYQSTYDTNQVSFGYKHKVLTRKYKKKAERIRYQVVAVKIKNDSPNDLEFGSDISIKYSNGDPLPLIDNAQVFNKLKQVPAGYILYLLLTPSYLTTSSSSGGIEKNNTIPIGLVLAPALTLGNALYAANSNRSFKEELMYHNLNNKTIPAGQTIYGIITYHSFSPESLKIELH